jgi:hypothetical protein
VLGRGEARRAIRWFGWRLRRRLSLTTQQRGVQPGRTCRWTRRAQRASIGLSFQFLELLPQTGQTLVDRTVAEPRFELVDQASQLVFDAPETLFEIGVASLGGRCALLRLTHLLGDQRLGLALAAHQERDGFDQQVVLVGHIGMRQVGGHQAEL